MLPAEKPPQLSQVDRVRVDPHLETGIAPVLDDRTQLYPHGVKRITLKKPPCSPSTEFRPMNLGSVALDDPQFPVAVGCIPGDLYGE
jgi:hypothetical protein